MVGARVQEGERPREKKETHHAYRDDMATHVSPGKSAEAAITLVPVEIDTPVECGARGDDIHNKNISLQPQDHYQVQ